MKSNFLQRRIDFQISFTVSQLLSLVLIFLGFAYLVWELYWFQKVGYYFIKWHTRIAFTALLAGLLLFSVLFFVGILLKSETRKRLLSIGLGIWFGLIIFEIALSFLNINKSYSETRTGYYRSPFEPEPDNLYHVYHANSTVKNTAPEFSFTNSYNSLGYLGSEWALHKTKAKRIITIGDSFTEGDGSPSDSCYPSQLQNMVDPQVEILNAGVRGSDPVFGIKNMEDRLLPYKPDIVVQAVSENDVIFDFCIRGGYERFQRNGTVVFRSPPKWEPIYAISNLFRMCFNVFGLDIGNPCGDPYNPSLIEERNKILRGVIDRYEKLGANHHFKTVILFYPTKDELIDNSYFFDFKPTKAYIDSLSHVSYIDILPLYHKKLKLKKMKADAVFWKIDGHHNPIGYRLMAECVYESLLAKGLIEKGPIQKENL